MQGFKKTFLISILFLGCALLVPIAKLTFFNLNDLAVEYIDTLLYTIGFVILLSPVIYFLHAKGLGKFTLNICCAIFLASFVNSFFVPIDLPAADGRDPVDFVISGSARFITLAFVAFAFLISFYKESKFITLLRSNLGLVSALLCVFSLGFVSYTFMLIPDKLNNTGLERLINKHDENKAEAITFGPKNILILSFDQIQGSAFKGYLNSDRGSNANKLLDDGFVFFPDAVTSYPSTRFSLVGQAFGRTVKKDETLWMDHAFTDSNSFTKKVEKQGYKLYVTPQLKKMTKRDSYIDSNISPRLLPIYAFNIAFGANIIKFLPNPFYGELAKHKKLIDNDMFLKTLISDSQFDKNGQNTILFVHFLFTHQPFFTKSDCSLRTISEVESAQNIDGFMEGVDCVVNQLDVFFDKLKKWGIYDNTAIFILSDHGFETNINNLDVQKKYPEFFFENSSYVTPNNTKAIGAYNPLFLFKDFNSNDKLKVDNKIVSLNDVATTVCERVPGCPSDFKGKGLDVTKEIPSDRINSYWYYLGGEEDVYNRYHITFPEYWKKIKFSGPLDQAIPDLENAFNLSKSNDKR